MDIDIYDFISLFILLAMLFGVKFFFPRSGDDNE